MQTPLAAKHQRASRSHICHFAKQLATIGQSGRQHRITIRSGLPPFVSKCGKAVLCKTGEPNVIVDKQRIQHIVPVQHGSGQGIQMDA